MPPSGSCPRNTFVESTEGKLSEVELRRMQGPLSLHSASTSKCQDVFFKKNAFQAFLKPNLVSGYEGW